LLPDDPRIAHLGAQPIESDAAVRTNRTAMANRMHCRTGRHGTIREQLPTGPVTHLDVTGETLAPTCNRRPESLRYQCETTEVLAMGGEFPSQPFRVSEEPRGNDPLDAEDCTAIFASPPAPTTARRGSKTTRRSAERRRCDSCIQNFITIRTPAYERGNHEQDQK
jgi:hypothetical protein